MNHTDKEAKLYYGMKHIDGDNIPTGDVFQTEGEAQAFTMTDGGDMGGWTWAINDSYLLRLILEIVQELAYPANECIGDEPDEDYDIRACLRVTLTKLRKAGVDVPVAGNEMAYTVLCMTNPFWGDVMKYESAQAASDDRQAVEKESQRAALARWGRERTPATTPAWWPKRLDGEVE